jgi:hypothetical protein
MRVSELIAALQKLQAKHGDKRVFTYGWDEEDGTFLKELQDGAVNPIGYRVGNDTGVYGIGINN